MSDYTAMNDWRDYLAHHGVLGQKWGVQNGPPYPLGASDHSVSEKKAGWKRSLSGGADGKVKKKRGPIGIIKQKIDERNAAKGKYWSDKDEREKRHKVEGIIDEMVEYGSCDHSNFKNDDYWKEVKADLQKRKNSLSKEEKELLSGMAWAEKGQDEYNAWREEKKRKREKESFFNRFGEYPVEDKHRNVSDQPSKKPNGWITFSKEQQERELSNAKTKGQWSIDFLEAIQNKEIMYKNDNSAMLREYKKYLQDPEDYWKNKRNKLAEP